MILLLYLSKPQKNTAYQQVSLIKLFPMCLTSALPPTHTYISDVSEIFSKTHPVLHLRCVRYLLDHPPCPTSARPPTLSHTYTFGVFDICSTTHPVLNIHFRCVRHLRSHVNLCFRNFTKNQRHLFLGSNHSHTHTHTYTHI